MLRIAFKNTSLLHKLPFRFRTGLLTCLIASTQLAYGGVHTVHLRADSYRLIKTDRDQYWIRMEGFGSITEPGHPQLPSKVFYIALPPGTSVETISIQPQNFQLLPGTFDIIAAPPLVSTQPETGDISSFSGDFQKTKNTLYSTDAFLPGETAVVVGVDTWDNAPLVKIRFTPFSFNPVRRELCITHEIAVQITYSDPVAEQKRTEEEHTYPIHPEGKWIDERSLLKESWTQDPSNRTNGIPSLIIVGPSSVEETVVPFMQWKSFLGIATAFISIEQIFAEIEGNDKTEKIRNYLKTRHDESGVTHVLLIGYEDTIPMKKLYPDASNHNSSGAVPSDYYYSELSSVWDGDHDGYPGELSDDNVDWAPELVIGRIPWTDRAIVADILQKIILFEKDCGSWKNKALLIGAMANYKQENNASYYYTKTDGAVLMELLKDNLFSANKITLYEKEGIDSSEYDCDLPLTKDNLFSVWSSGSFGCVTWWAHGSYQSASRKWWRGDDGDNIPESGEIGWQKFIIANDYPVNPSYQPIVFANSCDNGWPEMESLGRTLIRNGCSGIVSSSRTSWYVLGWKDVQFGGNASLAYLFWEQLISNPQSVGDAISSAKIEYMKRFNSAWQHLHNIYAFNYFGDPTLVLTGQTPSYGGLSGSVFSGDGEAIPQQGIHVEIAGLSLSTETGKDGEFQFLYLPGGSYTLTFSGDDCPVFQTEVQIVAGEMKHIDISVPSSAAPAIQTSVSFLSITLHEDNIRETFLRVTNTGSDNLLIHSQRTDPDADWLIVDSTQFNIPPGDCDSIRVSCRSLELDQGMFESQFQLITNIEENSIIPIPVSMTVIDTIPPAPINDLVMMEMENDSVTLVWTAPGDNGLTGKAEHYEIWISNQSTNNIVVGNSTILSDTLTPNNAGTPEQVRISLESSDQTRWIWIKTWDEAGFASNSNSISLVSTGISETAATVPRDFATQNYPNPFNGSTQIEFGISRPGKVKISVYNERGQFVKCLVDENLDSGHHTTAWHALDAYSRPVSSGIYFYTVETESQRVIQKMLLLK